MGLFKLLTFPVSGPLAGGKWVLRTLMDEAARKYYDEAAIRQEMQELERRLLSGAISDEAFEQQEEALLERLLQAREYRRQALAEKS
jgi:hypothetical protein